MLKDSQPNVQRTKEGCMHLYVTGVEVVECSLPQSVPCFIVVVEKIYFCNKRKECFE